MKVREFLEQARGDEGGFDFNRFVPYPVDFAALDGAAAEWGRENPPPWSFELWKSRPKDGYNQGGYDWCIEHWGTKWNAHRVEVQEMSTWEGQANVEIHFNTAWAPPLPVMEKASELFPELRFELRYFERGAAFNGMFICEGGKVALDKSGEYFGYRGG